MARDAAAVRPFTLAAVHPWVYVLVGLGLALFSLWFGMAVEDFAAVRVGSALLGLAVALSGVGLYLRRIHWDRPYSDESLTAGMTAWASLFVVAPGFFLFAWIAHLANFPSFFASALGFGGCLSALNGAVLRLRTRGTQPNTIDGAGMLTVAAMTSLLCWCAMDEKWDAGKMFFAAGFIASLAGALLMLLPPLGRKIFLSLFIVFHFGGMVTAVTSIDPPNSTGPWVSKQLWTYVYRPYLSFMYMTNAYHFYSPDPGPPSHYWFSVNYEDGSRTWVKVPNRETSAIGMQYQRNLALPEHTFTANSRLPYTSSEIAEIRLRQPDFRVPRGYSWEYIYQMRTRGSLGTSYLYPATWTEKGKEVTKPLPIPMVYEQSLNLYLQYREPHEVSKQRISSVARRIMLTAPKKLDEDGKVVPVKSVKVYRVTHRILSPRELSEGVDPLEKTKHMAYYLGEHDTKGKLIDSDDPFLYWYLPIVNVPNRYKDYVQQPGNNVPPFVQFDLPAKKDANNPEDNTFVLDCVEMHAAGEVRVKQQKGN